MSSSSTPKSGVGLLSCTIGFWLLVRRGIRGILAPPAPTAPISRGVDDPRVLPLVPQVCVFSGSSAFRFSFALGLAAGGGCATDRPVKRLPDPTNGGGDYKANISTHKLTGNINNGLPVAQPRETLEALQVVYMV